MAPSKPKILSEEFIEDSDDDVAAISERLASQSTPVSPKSTANSSQVDSPPSEEAESQSQSNAPKTKAAKSKASTTGPEIREPQLVEHRLAYIVLTST